MSDATHREPPSPGDSSPFPESPLKRLVERLEEDQRARWGRGERVLTEDYLASYPVLGENPDAVVDLLYNEFLLRLAAGEEPRAEEYLRRFPQLGQRLLDQFEVHEALQFEQTFPATSAAERTALVGGPPAAAEGCRPTIPGHELLEELGRGGMGVVYKARQVRLNRVVALKVLKDEALAGPEGLERFRKEAEAVARLQHPNVVHIHEVGEYGGRPFFSMEYIEGGSLARRLDGTPLHPQQAAALGEALARAIHHAHQRGIVHRDLKPANILLASGGREPPASTLSVGAFGLPLADCTLKITDFGLAKFLAGAAQPTETGAILGTPNYMAPEQAAGKVREVGPATDVYALGAMLYEMLTGHPPFRGQTPLDTIQQLLHTEPVSLRRLQPRVPRDLETVCLKCLHKEPRKRYVTALDLADDLGRFLRHEPICARPLGRVGRAVRWCHRKPAQAVAGGLAVLTLAAAIVLPVLFGVYEAGVSARLRSALQEADRSAASLALDRALSLCEQGDVGRGVLWLAHSLELATAAGDTDLQRVIRANLAGWGREFHSLHACLPHAGWVQTAVFSGDGRAVVTGGDDGAARLWDAATGEPLGPPLSHGKPVKWVGTSPDLGVIVTLDEEGVARLWPATPEGRNATPLAHGARVLAAALSPDGRTLLTAGADGRARVWEAPVGKCIASLDHPGPVGLLAFSPDGRKVATGCADHNVRLWDLATRKLLRALAHPSPLCSMIFSPDGRTILTGCEDGTARLWKPDTAAQPPALRHGGAAVNALAFSPDGRTIVTGGRDWKARLWNAATGRPHGVTSLQHFGPVTAVAFSPDGRLILTAGLESRAYLWDAATGQPFRGPMQYQGEVQAAAFSPDGRKVLIAGQDSAARIWRVDPEKVAVRSVVHPEWPYAMAFGPGGRLLATGGEEPDNGGGGYPVRLWDMTTGTLRFPPLRHAEPIRALQLSTDGRLLLTGCEDGKVRLWDTSTGAPRGEYSVRGKVYAATLSGNGKWLAAGTHEGAIHFWELGGPPDPVSLGGHRAPVRALAISPDGRLVLSGGADLTARLWDTAARRPVGEPLRHQGQVWAVAFSPDGRMALTGSDDRVARLWDAATGRPLGAPFLDRHPVRVVAFNPECTLVLTGGWGGASRLWDVATRKPIGIPLRHGGAALATAFDDGKVRLASDEDRAARAWEVLQPLPGDCERFTLWAQVATSMELGPDEGVYVLGARAWEERRQRLEERGGPPLP